MKIEYRTIGIVHSPFEHSGGTPIQPSRANGARGTVEIFDEFVEGLRDLDGFSHVILLCHLHKARRFRLRVVPFLDTVPRGLFATRAPSRPSPIGLSVVRLLGIDGNTLAIEDVDLLEGTPVIDIKPYVREFDDRVESREGWLESARKGVDLADDRFGAGAARDKPTETPTGDTPMTQTRQDRCIDYVEFLTTDMVETKKFYSGAFGWAFTDYGPDYASFSDGRLAGGFTVARKVEAGGPLVVLYAVDLEGIQLKIVELGGRIVRETFEFPGGRRFHFADPSGNELAVWSDQ